MKGVRCQIERDTVSDEGGTASDEGDMASDGDTVSDREGYGVR